MNFYRATLLLAITAHSLSAQTWFVPNLGQWEGSFEYTARFGNTDFFMDSCAFSFIQWNYAEDEHLHKLPKGGHFYRIHFLGSNPKAPTVGLENAGHYLNYFLGKRKFWRTGIYPAGRVIKSDFYSGVDLHVYTQYGYLKYDLWAENVGDLRDIKLYYEGVDSLYIKEGRLHTRTSQGETVEIRPYTYNPETNKPIQSDYRLRGDTVYFDIDPDYNGPAVLDPAYIFSTYIGSTQDNFGYSATYDPIDSTVYAAGIVLNLPGVYPTTPGAFDSTYNGSVDVTISKISPDGTSLIYSTYLGSSEVEQPASLVVDSLGRLAVLGTTSSVNFPVTANAFDTSLTISSAATVENFNYVNGVDMFVTVFEPNGTNLFGSTFLGGNGRDGNDRAIGRNYGDPVRGEIIVTPWNTLMIASTTTSTDIPLVNAHQDSIGGAQDAWLLELPLSCDSLLWSTYFGGGNQDAGLSLRISPDRQSVYACGGTISTDLQGTSGAYDSTYSGNTDGFVAAWDVPTRTLKRTTYNGTTSYDVNFLMDIDRHGKVFVFGQTLGNYPTTSGAIDQTHSSVFVSAFSDSLDAMDRSLSFGNGMSGSLAISPTAFAVDQCGDIYLSGWGGNLNGASSTTNMPVTSNAFQNTTDGNDLYFAVIDASFSKFNYATYFGGAGQGEHVDGGTSRFDSRGIIFQAVCADCYDMAPENYPIFPPNVISPTNPSPRCNLAVTVIDFEQQYANVSVSAPDTVCSPFQLVLNDSITGSDIVIWDFGNGDVDTSATLPFRTYNAPGTYSVTVIGIDTNCGTTDTAHVVFEVVPGTADASFNVQYDRCDPNFDLELSPVNYTSGTFYWDFGDGMRDTSFSGPVSHRYNAGGTYTVRAIHRRNDCIGFVSDTVEVEIFFHQSPSPPQIAFTYGGCAGSATGEITVSGGSGYDSFSWQLSDGRTFNGRYHEFPVSDGTLTITLVSTDTSCGITDTRSASFDVTNISTDFKAVVPNVFSPNGDGMNDVFKLQNSFNPADLSGFVINIYDRWGQLLFSDVKADFGWDGTVSGRAAPEGTYFWVMSGETICGQLIESHGSVEIMK